MPEVKEIFGVFGEIGLFIPSARSLKDRRRVLKSLIDRLRGTCNISVADCSDRGSWQNATLDFALVASSVAVLHEQLQKVQRQIDRYPDGVEAVSFWYEYINHE